MTSLQRYPGEGRENGSLSTEWPWIVNITVNIKYSGRYFTDAHILPPQIPILLIISLNRPFFKQNPFNNFHLNANSKAELIKPMDYFPLYTTRWAFN